MNKYIFRLYCDISFIVPINAASHHDLHVDLLCLVCVPSSSVSNVMK